MVNSVLADIALIPDVNPIVMMVQTSNKKPPLQAAFYPAVTWTGLGFTLQTKPF